MTDVDRVDIRTDECADDPGEPSKLIAYPFRTPCSLDRRAIRERIRALEPHDVRVGHDSHHAPPRVHHGE